MLAVSVETQPGLTELLLDLKSKDKNGRQEVNSIYILLYIINWIVFSLKSDATVALHRL